MIIKNKAGMTLVEALIAIVLVGVLLVGIIGAFYISRLSMELAKHRFIAMSEIKKYLEEEISFGYNDGNYGTVTSATPIAVTDMSDVGGTIKPDPYPPTISTIGATSYRKIGFTVEWNERFVSRATPWKERAVVYVQ